jgi:hypothetical protein
MFQKVGSRPQRGKNRLSWARIAEKQANLAARSSFLKCDHHRSWAKKVIHFARREYPSHQKTKVTFFLNRISSPLKKANISRQMSSLAGNRTPFDFS